MIRTCLSYSKISMEIAIALEYNGLAWIRFVVRAAVCVPEKEG